MAGLQRTFDATLAEALRDALLLLADQVLHHSPVSCNITILSCAIQYVPIICACALSIYFGVKRHDVKPKLFCVTVPAHIAIPLERLDKNKEYSDN